MWAFTYVLDTMLCRSVLSGMYKPLDGGYVTDIEVLEVLPYRRFWKCHPCAVEYSVVFYRNGRKMEGPNEVHPNWIVDCDSCTFNMMGE